MSSAYIVGTALWAAWVGFSAGLLLFRTRWMVQALTTYGAPRSWWPWIGTAKTAAAVGLVVGLYIPPIGAIATSGIVVYLIGAVVFVVRARVYSHAVLMLL